MISDSPDRKLSIREIAEWLGVGLTTAKKYVRDKNFPVFREGRNVWAYRSEVELFRLKHTVKAKPLDWTAELRDDWRSQFFLNLMQGLLNDPVCRRKLEEMIEQKFTAEAQRRGEGIAA